MKDDEKEPKKINSLEELDAYLSELGFYIDHYFEGVRLAKEGDLLEAEMMFRKSLEGHQDAAGWFSLAQSLELQSKQAYAKAVEFHQKHLKETREEYGAEIPEEYFTEGPPEEMQSLHNLALSLYRQYKIEEAQETLLYILSMKRDEVLAWELLMRCLLITGRFREAENVRQLIAGLKEKNDISLIAADMQRLSDYSPQQVLEPFNLMIRWAGNAPDFLLDILQTLERVVGGPVKRTLVIEQAIRQGMTKKLAEETMKQLVDEGLAFNPKKGWVHSTTA